MSNQKQGLAAFETGDYSKAFKLLNPLAQQGDAEAQCLIANMHHLGLGVERNIAEAIKWYTKSAAQDYAIASNNLAGIYATGSDGVEKDLELAQKLYRQANEQGFLHVPEPRLA